MKNIRIFTLLLSICFAVSSCYEDKGNYDYDDREVITIDGIAERYVIEGEDVLSITPTVSSNKADADFEYLWEILDVTNKGISAEALSVAKDLETTISRSTKEYTLALTVKNAKTGYSVVKTAELLLTKDFFRGWYILKDNGENTDMDFYAVKSEESAIPESQIPLKDILSSMNNGYIMPGKAVSFAYTDKMSLPNENMSGIRENIVKAFFVTSEKNIVVVETENLKIARNNENAFVVPPTTCNFGVVISHNTSMHILNNGRCQRTDMFYNPGCLLGVEMNLEGLPEHHLSPHVARVGYQHLIFFDETTSSFAVCQATSTYQPYWGIALDPDNSSDTDMSAHNMNKRCLYMGARDTETGVSVLEDKTTGERMVVWLHTISGGYYFYRNLNLRIASKIASGDKAAKATMFTTSTDENILFMVADDGNLWSRNLSSGAERLEYSVPANETITFIKHYISRDGTFFPDGKIHCNYIVIGTSNGSGTDATYNIRMFERRLGQLADSPSLTLTGSGYAKDLLYITPSVTGGWVTNNPK